MQEPIYQEALDAYTLPANQLSVFTLSGGLINNSFKVTNEKLHYSFLLQQINHNVFTNPADVQDNYQLLWEFIIEKKIKLHIPAPKYFLDNKNLFIDNKNNYWRVFEFIENSMMLPIAESTAQAKDTAKTFAEFTASFSKLNIELIKETIPDFHNLGFRFRQFRESVERGNAARNIKAAYLINELNKRINYVHFFESLKTKKEFPKRVMHHDAKIANILFDKTNGKVICPVDFDTVMPGYFFSDLGDMIRSMACSLDESSVDFENISIRKDFYQAITEGYLSVMNNQFTPAEKSHIHHAGILMIYMQALRYLADYLNEDIYYRINYPEQNFDRAKNQFILLNDLEQFLEIEM